MRLKTCFDENGQTIKPEKRIIWSTVTIVKVVMEMVMENKYITKKELNFPGKVKVTRKMEILDASLDKLMKNDG